MMDHRKANLKELWGHAAGAVKALADLEPKAWQSPSNLEAFAIGCRHAAHVFALLSDRAGEAVSVALEDADAAADETAAQ